MIRKPLIFLFLLLIPYSSNAENPALSNSATSPAAKSNKYQTGKEVHLPGTKGGPMINIPAGGFMMGCNSGVDKECNKNEKPYHHVNLDIYYLDKYEVAVGEYAKCVEAGRCAEPATGRYCNWGKPELGNYPINCVDWNQAGNYCRWAGKRLPTEAEWEKAARGSDGRKYPWGNQDATCYYAVMSQGGDGCSRRSTWPVGSRPAGASPYGIMDMAGNVWEWVADWYGEQYYGKSPAANPKGPASGKQGVLRGGSWSDFQETVRASERIGIRPARNNSDYGFRCARDAK